MAVYAAVTSLMGTMHLISQSSLDFQESNKECSKSLYEKVGSLLEFLDNSDNELMKDLQKKVKDLANKIEDEVESQVLQIMEKDEHIQTEANERLRKILEQAIEDIDSVNEELRKQRNKNNNSLSGNCSLGGSTSPRSRVSTLENDMVGHSDEQARVRVELIGHSSLLEVISITGMGGIGKSTFAKTMFSDPSVMGFFDVRGWITVSKDYSLRKMLLSLLQDAIGVNEVLDKKPDNELADCLQKCLKGRRYLIVVDDIWSTKAWEDIRLWFPENNNRSRILLTTRIMEVARDASYPKNLFPMRFLDPEESWNLFCQKAFSKNDCPTEFESVGKVVVENCKGLPLMISVVAGSLSSKRTLDEWNEVAQSVSSLVNLDDYQRCSGVLALSYNHLPSHLKACFLYFGVFKKASEISIENLIRLWIAEGLFKLRGIGDLEKEACSLLHDLIDRSLIVICKHSLDGKIKTCRIHDLLHDLCLRESVSESLLYVSNTSISGTNVPQHRRWVSFHQEPVLNFFSLTFPTYCKTRSLHFLAVKPYRTTFELGLDRFKLLRVLDLLGSNLIHLSNVLANLVSLRYLRGDFSGYPLIYKLRNLQFLSFCPVNKLLPKEIHLPDGTWKMSQLRHLHSSSFYLCSPPKISGNKYRVLENLQSVHGLRPVCCTKEMFEGIKKVRKLGICGKSNHFYDAPECLDYLIYLPELEKLKILLYDPYGSDLLHKQPVPCMGSFPPNLKKLALQGTHLLWSKLTIISKLPKLKVLQFKALKLFGDELGETVWKVSEMGFPKLKSLLIEKKGLKNWKATDDSFPCLERVIIKNCRFLQEIPKEFADSMTLKRIELWGCTPSLVNFAKEIQEEQEILGNNILQVYAYDTIRGYTAHITNRHKKS
ncbi:putative late blight resistance protein homolog R1B-16 isoform X1 [Solanum stenotomum]|uniref:putative late blight resistance protein homolog R1B-16 isoform X1 n=1 Tax=Solanum stenotomum TaxID=172797 RepID=UPI0020D07148|nr:putative late blight resistance protein homolog R1B-16 isoform X1 [Solanum stenotomum]